MLSVKEALAKLTQLIDGDDYIMASSKLIFAYIYFGPWNDLSVLLKDVKIE